MEALVLLLCGISVGCLVMYFRMAPNKAAPAPSAHKMPAKSKAEIYSDAVNLERNALLIVPDRASLPALDPIEYSYRPASGERLVAVETSVSRLELKSTGRYASGALSVSIPIMKGVRYRASTGRIASQKEWQVTDKGRLLLTDKAIAFEGSTRNERIPWSQISEIELMLDGYRIARRTGPPRVFAVDKPEPRFAALVDLMASRVG